ncbi:MAG: hypothetical protein M0Z27_04205 [Thermaerobacter sp.]|nr:hypothetical protein [Thermaerobacter sp.]
MGKRAMEDAAQRRVFDGIEKATVYRLVELYSPLGAAALPVGVVAVAPGGQVWYDAVYVEEGGPAPDQRVWEEELERAAAAAGGITVERIRAWVEDANGITWDLAAAEVVPPKGMSLKGLVIDLMEGVVVDQVGLLEGA